MCRLMAYIGPPVLVADVVLWPDRRCFVMSACRDRPSSQAVPAASLSAAKLQT